MKSKPIVRTIILLASFVFFSKTLFAQQIPSPSPQTLNASPQALPVQMTGAKMRAPLDVPQGKTTVALCNLVPGNTYTAIAVNAAQGQTATFRLEPSGQNAQPVQRLSVPNAVRFTATGECAEFLLTANDEPGITSISMYFSVKCETCPEANAWKKNLLNATGAAVLEVDGGQSAEELITGTLIDGECFDVEDVTFSGNFGQIGTFSNGLSNIGFESGMIIATGDVSVAPGPNDQDNASAGFGNSTPDFDLTLLSGSAAVFDLADIEFDFTPTETPISFEYVFASEEYCEYVGSQFNDAFGFFISGPGISGPFGGAANIAAIGSGTYVTINNVNHLSNSGLYVNNQPFWSGNLCGQNPSFAPAVNEVQFDGFTHKLTAIANVVPCQTYHIRLKIADVGDGIFDSAVFLKGGSFDGGGSATVDFTVNGDPSAAEAQEGCGAVNLVIDRVGSNLSQPITVSFSVGGTATPGVDYSPLDSAYIIPAGQDQLVVPVTIFSDLLAEGAETIVLTLDNSCSCDVQQKELTILDYLPMADTTIFVSICNSGDGATLTANPLGGTPPYTYQWSTNETTPSIFVNPTVTTSYAVTIVDMCSDTAVNYFLVQVSPLVEIIENVAFCPGDSVTLGDSVYTQSAMVMDTLPGQNGACDTILTYNLTLLPFNTLMDTVAFCSGDTVFINGVAYTQAGTVMDTLPGIGGGCDTIATYILQLLPLNASTDTIAFCTGDTVFINGVAYTQAGTVTDTLPGMGGGCDTVATYILQLLPLNTLTDTVSFCPGSSVAIGDSVYTQPGIAIITLPGSNGSCDTVATYILQWLPQASFTDTIVFCPGESVAIGDSVYTQPGTVLDTLPGLNGACDTLATYILILLPQVSFTDTIAFCPGASVAIGDSVYTQPGTVLDTLPGLNGACDTLATYILTLLPQVSFTDTIPFCPGDSIFINGNAYTQAGTFPDTLAGANGACDTLATYVLVSLTPAPSLVTLVCPDDIEVVVEPPVVQYDLPLASTDCVCPGLSLQLTSGLPSGSTFPVGITAVCYVAKDSCGNTASCCFEVNVPDEEPCDEATIGCIKYELLSITKNGVGEKTYRIRVTNTCPNKLMYAAFQLPNGVTAVAPADNSTYTAPSGREYSVRNPNFSPFYSIRFKYDAGGIANGESDIFEFTLPAQASPLNIHVVVRVQPKIFYETYLNTSNCQVETVSKPGQQGESKDFPSFKNLESLKLNIFPNPTDGNLFADLSDWQGERVELQLFDSRGQRVQYFTMTADAAPQEIELPKSLASGLYFLKILSESGERQVARFVLQR